MGNLIKRGRKGKWEIETVGERKRRMVKVYSTRKKGGSGRERKRTRVVRD